MGLVCASVYILLLILFIPFAFSDVFVDRFMNQKKSAHGLAVDEFPHYQVCAVVLVIFRVCNVSKIPPKLSVYLSSLLSLMMATLLGFLDDVFDIRWRHKLPVPIIASIPLLMVYFAEGGNTNVVVPKPFRWILGSLVNLGNSVPL
jgi:UDP-N-acetylglucosamine--dolichyl-phosphate N-acetylglucosaminephosphotransferase